MLMLPFAVPNRLILMCLLMWNPSLIYGYVRSIYMPSFFKRIVNFKDELKLELKILKCGFKSLDESNFWGGGSFLYFEPYTNLEGALLVILIRMCIKVM